jgi:hypothetical protein
LETITKNHAHITAQISGLVGMIRPDHRAFPLLADLAPKARFTVVAQSSYSDSPAILARVANNPAIDDLVAKGQVLFQDGQVTTEGDDNQSFLVRVSDLEGTVLVAQRFSADTSPEAEVYSTLFAGNEDARVAIAERFLTLLEKAQAADFAANQRLVATAQDIF